VTYCFDHDSFSGSVAKIRKQVFLTFWNRGNPPFLEGSFRQKPIFATKPKFLTMPHRKRKARPDRSVSAQITMKTPSGSGAAHSDVLDLRSPLGA
jgi:hypothetical protein